MNAMLLTNRNFWREALNPMAAVFIVMLVFQIGLLAWVVWLARSPPFLSYKNVPFTVVTPVVHPGDTVTLHVQRCNSDTRTRTYVTTREMVNVRTKNTVIQPSTLVSLPTGCSLFVSKINSVPTDTLPGYYYFRGDVEINDHIVTQFVSWRTEPFEVVP